MCTSVHMPVVLLLVDNWKSLTLTVQSIYSMVDGNLTEDATRGSTRSNQLSMFKITILETQLF